MLTEVPRLAGTDGRKMSKSFHNAINLKDSSEVIKNKISTMMTDTRRKRRKDPGNPDDCPVFTLHKAFVPKNKREEIIQGCQSAGIGCLECKQVIIDTLIKELFDFRKKRKKFEENPDLVWEILEQGNQKARKKAKATMEEVRKKIGF